MGNSTPLTGCITFLAVLLVVGAMAEVLYRVNPTAAYLFVFLVIMGYLAAGDNLAVLTQKAGVSTKG